MTYSKILCLATDVSIKYHLFSNIRNWNCGSPAVSLVLPCWKSDISRLQFSEDQLYNDETENGRVQDEDGAHRDEEQVLPGFGQPAGLSSDVRLEDWLGREGELGEEESEGESEGAPPAHHRVNKEFPPLRPASWRRRGSAPAQSQTWRNIGSTSSSVSPQQSTSASLTKIKAQDRHPHWSGEKREVESEANYSAGDEWGLNDVPDTDVTPHQDDQNCGEGDADDVADDDLAVKILEVRNDTVDQGGNEETYQASNADGNVNSYFQLWTFTQVDSWALVSTSETIPCVLRKLKNIFAC